MKNKPFALFSAICLFVSFTAVAVVELFCGDMGKVQMLVFSSLYMVIPLLSVVLTQLITGERVFSKVGISFRMNRWWLVSLLVMPLFCSVVVFVSALFPGTELSFDSEAFRNVKNQLEYAGWHLNNHVIVAFQIFSGIVAGATVNALLAFGEEVAWRGFLLRILKLGFWKKSLVIGLLWGFWHAPLIMMGLNYPSHPYVGVLLMMVFCVLLTPVFIYIAEKSGSVITASIVHGTMNAEAGLSILCLAGYNELLCGPCGLAGFILLALMDLVVYWKQKSAE